MQKKPIAAIIEKIAKECEEANADKWTITKIVKQLASQEQTGIKNLRKKALLMLQQLDPRAAAIYASFQRMQVRTSMQLVESFDRGNIIKSLLRETEVARGVAEKIGREVEEKIKDLKIENINTPLIREMVNVKLLEYGHENIRNQYTRLGLPVFEVQKKVEQLPYSNKAILTEYNLLRVIPNRLAKMHLSNQIFIAEIQDFSTKPIGVSIVPEISETPKDTVFNLLQKANRLEKFFSWRPNVSALNLAIAAKSGKRKAADVGSLFAKAAKAVFISGKTVPAFNTIHLFEPDLFSGKGIERESMATAANSMLKANSEEKFPAFDCAVAIDTKYKLLMLHKSIQPIVLNCKDREWNLVNGIAVQKDGLCSFSGLNLTSIALGCKGNETAFFEQLGKKAEAIKQLDSLKRKQLSGRSYIRKQGIAIESLCSGLALDSLFEASKTAIDSEKESEALAFSEKVLSELGKLLSENFVLTELQNKAALHRFEARNRKDFHVSKKRLAEERHLRKSKVVRKQYCFVAKAESRRELNELIDSNIRLVEFTGK